MAILNKKEISERIKALENDRVSRLESEVNNREVKGQEEIIQSLSDRVEKIEELSAKTTTDERVPSILTAIEALESKVAQIEGKTVTEESTETGLIDYSSYKAELGRLAKAFDLINQRLTALELKLKS